jgi:hypothetical protein
MLKTTLLIDDETRAGLDALQGRLLADHRLRVSRTALIEQAVKLLAREAQGNVELLAYRLRS